MVAQVLSLFQSRHERQRSADWSTQELAEFYRVESTLVQAGLSVSIDRGLTDEGDPWCVFCRASDGEVIIHFAKLNGEYLIVSGATGQALRGSDFRRLLTEFALTNPTLVQIKSVQGARLLIHPAALLAAIVATAFFQVFGSEAVASEVGRGPGESEVHKDDFFAIGSGEPFFPHFHSARVEREQVEKQIIAVLGAMIGLTVLDAHGSYFDILDRPFEHLFQINIEKVESPNIAVLAKTGDSTLFNRVHSENVFSSEFSDRFLTALDRVSTTFVSQGSSYVVVASVGPQSLEYGTPLADPILYRMNIGADEPMQLSPHSGFPSVPWMLLTSLGSRHIEPIVEEAAAHRVLLAENSLLSAPRSLSVFGSSEDGNKQGPSSSAFQIVNRDLTLYDRSAVVTVLAIDLTVRDIILLGANSIFSPVSATYFVDLFNRTNLAASRVDIGGRNLVDISVSSVANSPQLSPLETLPGTVAPILDAPVVVSEQHAQASPPSQGGVQLITPGHEIVQEITPANNVGGNITPVRVVEQDPVAVQQIAPAQPRVTQSPASEPLFPVADSSPPHAPSPVSPVADSSTHHAPASVSQVADSSPPHAPAPVSPVANSSLPQISEPVPPVAGVSTPHAPAVVQSSPTSSQVALPPAQPATSAPVASASHADTTDKFDQTADALIREFVKENHVKVFSTGKNVVLIDVEPSHYSGDHFILRTWAMDDGSSISIIGQLAHDPSPLV